MHQEHFTPMAFDFLWESAELGDLPYPLRNRSHGATEAERRALRNRTDVELKARGIRDSRGRLEPRIEDWLYLLARGSLTIDALHIPEFQAPTIAVLGATDGRDGVLAIQDQSGIWLREAPADGLPTAVVDLLPPGQRGSEASVTLPIDDARRTQPIRAAVNPTKQSEESEAAKTRRKEKARVSLSERITADPREAFGKLTGQPRLRGGQLAANSRSHVGAKQRSRVLGWFDTVSGRYLSTSQAGPDGREWVTVSPADVKTLRMRLGEMVAGVAVDTR
ncbi:hypothetical protein SD37_02910 [Amycolatopsis orientalis]|uniref:ESX secretion-associated protein EspG n=1 Tax=Amycolatopsis orientalis TaxID=31958 RepID=A0A193BR87_AMYOR|nr:ESX secretion-associated protein EspG [Amycolatopsis orientalis]ANN14705.1 hypothetical protein SD37_02910 [Amycolatopsis orientalis]